MQRTNLLAVVIILFFAVFFFQSHAHGETEEAQDNRGFIENKKYAIEVNISRGGATIDEHGDITVGVKNKNTGKEFGAKTKAGYVTNIQKIFFVEDDIFLVEAYFGAARGLLIGFVGKDSVKLIQIRLGHYLISPDNSGFVYTEWRIPTEGPEVLYLFNFKEARKVGGDYKGKISFDTYKYKDVAEHLIINGFVWGKGAGGLFLLCQRTTRPDFTVSDYLVRHNIATGKSIMFKDPVIASSKMGRLAFSWNDKEKSVDIVYVDRDSRNEYSYRFYDVNDLKMIER